MLVPNNASRHRSGWQPLRSSGGDQPLCDVPESRAVRGRRQACTQAIPLKPCNWLPEASTITLRATDNTVGRDQQRTEVWLKERAVALKSGLGGRVGTPHKRLNGNAY